MFLFWQFKDILNGKYANRYDNYVETGTKELYKLFKKAWKHDLKPTVVEKVVWLIQLKSSNENCIG
jgi:hypothetical protein